MKKNCNFCCHVRRLKGKLEKKRKRKKENKKKRREKRKKWRWDRLIEILMNRKEESWFVIYVSARKLSLCPLCRVLLWKVLYPLILTSEIVTTTFPYSQRNKKCGIASEMRVELRWARFPLLIRECVRYEMYVDCCWKNRICMIKLTCKTVLLARIVTR